MPLNAELLAELPAAPITEGDAGLVIKADGSVVMFNLYGARHERDFTPEQIETGKQLIALTVALKVPTIMNILLQMASDPDIVGAMN